MSLLDQAWQYALDQWQCKPYEMGLEEITDLFQWMKQHALFQATHRDRRRLRIVVPNSGDLPRAFQDSSLIPVNVDLANQIFAREGTKLNLLDPESLALTIRSFLSGIGGCVGSAGFLVEQAPNLKFWLKRSPEDEALFAQCCQGPSLNTTGERWTLNFYYFTPQGGVERWTAQGDSSNITKAQWKDFLPPRTFLFPYA